MGTGDRTHSRKKEGCAERIAPIGTLSQNGYGDNVMHRKGTIPRPSGGRPFAGLRSFSWFSKPGWGESGDSEGGLASIRVQGSLARLPLPSGGTGPASKRRFSGRVVEGKGPVHPSWGGISHLAPFPVLVQPDTSADLAVLI